MTVTTNNVGMINYYLFIVFCAVYVCSSKQFFMLMRYAHMHKENKRRRNSNRSINKKKKRRKIRKEQSCSISCICVCHVCAFFCSSFSIQCCVFFCARAQCTIFTCANSTINLVQCWEGLFSTNQSVQFASAFVLPIPYNQPNEKETKQTRALCFVHSVRFATANDNVMKSHLSFLEFLLHTRSSPQAKARLQSIFPIPICVRNAFHFCPSPNRCSIRSKSFCVYFILLCMVFCFHIHFAMHSPLSELKSSEAFCCCWCKSADFARSLHRRLAISS